MNRLVEQVVRSMRRRSTSVLVCALMCSVALFTSMFDATVAFADRDTPQFHRGACQGAYPGWLRGVVDGYHELSMPSGDPTGVLAKVPTPAVLTSADERLGYGDGLMAGFTLGMGYGAELGRAARTADFNTEKMGQMTAQFQTYVATHCGDLVAALDWNTTFMNAAGTSTVASLNESQLAMHFAVSANQEAIAAEASARRALEAKAEGDEQAALKFREAAQLAAQLAGEFAQMAKSHAATGREEAVQAIIDAQAAADRAKKAAESTDG